MSGENPTFLDLDDVLEFHAEQIAAFGGDPSIRDIHLLESALAQPRQSFGGQFLHGDLATMAAAYLFHIVQNHPFVDGNKRTGIHTAHVFLILNGVSIDLPVDRTEAMVLDVATGKLTKEQIADFFRSLIRTDTQP
jgi:death on curing protein